MSEKLFQNNSKVKTDIFYSVVFVLVLWYVFSTYDAFEIIMGKVEFYEGIELDELLLVLPLSDLFQLGLPSEELLILIK